MSIVLSIFNISILSLNSKNKVPDIFRKNRFRVVEYT
jgi:hypothetical protein